MVHFTHTLYFHLPSARDNTVATCERSHHFFFTLTRVISHIQYMNKMTDSCRTRKGLANIDKINDVSQMVIEELVDSPANVGNKNILQNLNTNTNI